jgi:hypothetical protein
MMALINNNGESVLPAGKIKINVSGSLPGTRSEILGAAKPVAAELSVE